MEPWFNEERFNIAASLISYAGMYKTAWLISNRLNVIIRW